MNQLKPPPRSIEQVVSVTEIDDTPDRENPNKMSDEDFRGLLDAVMKLDFAQAITLDKRPDGRYRIVDGNHRKRAAEAAGLAAVPAIIYDNLPEPLFRALRLSLNRWRGEARQSVVHEDLRFLHSEGLSRDTLFAVCGLPSEELDAVLELTSDVGGGETELDLPDPDAELPAPTKPSTIGSVEIPCSSPTNRDVLMGLIKRASRMAKAKGKYKLEATLITALRAYVGDA